MHVRNKGQNRGFSTIKFIQIRFYFSEVIGVILFHFNRHSYVRKSSIVYTRWGKKTCPTDANLVFAGKFIVIPLLTVLKKILQYMIHKPQFCFFCQNIYVFKNYLDVLID